MPKSTPTNSNKPKAAELPPTIIPEWFQLGALPYTVRFSDSIRPDWSADIDYHLGEIRIARNTANGHHRATHVRQENSFCHELAHALLEDAGYKDTNGADEAFVERLGRALHCFLKTQRGEARP